MTPSGAGGISFHVTGVRDQRGRFAEGNQAAKRANKAAVRWLGERAAGTLDDRRRRAPDPRNTNTRLRDLVTNPAASVVTIDGFRFLAHDRVKAISSRAASYYRAVEHGSHYWVDQKIRLRFAGRPILPTSGTPPTQSGWGGKGVRAFGGRGFGPWTVITRPVPDYHYAEKAADDFTAHGVWTGLIEKELGRVGITNLRVSRR